MALPWSSRRNDLRRRHARHRVLEITVRYVPLHSTNAKQHWGAIIAKNQNTFAKKQREMEKKRKAEDKRNRRKEKKAAEAYAAANPPVEEVVEDGEQADGDVAEE